VAAQRWTSPAVQSRSTNLRKRGHVRVAGAAVGGAAGGLVGSLTNSGVPERDANVYAEGVRCGGTLVTAKVEDARPNETQAIQRHKYVGINARGDAYRSSGWSGFDTKTPAYTADQVERERALYR
jgi:uncharacterized protein YcfJ